MLADNPLNTDSNLFYIQVHDLNYNYWYKNAKDATWVDTENCIENSVLPEAVTIFEAKRIINENKKENKECTYYLIPATSTQIQVIK